MISFVSQRNVSFVKCCMTRDLNFQVIFVTRQINKHLSVPGNFFIFSCAATLQIENIPKTLPTGLVMIKSTQV